ncbi:MAG: M56 family metallopeptidase [Paludisphaera borealis]|uniref:M56 family metallopeptidase n=1 Tax=Paludisphaera borealis TaxID=1387353 RepID=UPI002850126E|nr:M56 family metallopeptidase [Paludisphaera borealis]MDR3618916.1 M56 family metallopeptidase [Paludisphaera borealis]
MLWWFAETSLVAGLLAALAAGFSRLRPITPTTRHLLWLAVLIKFVTPPLISSPWAVSWPMETKPAIERATLDAPLAAPALENLPAPRVVRVSWPPPEKDRDSVPAAAVAAPSPRPASARPIVVREMIQRWLFAGWLGGAIAVGLFQMVRIHHFQRRLRQAVPAPTWLADEAESIAARLGVKVPELLAVAELGSPMIWCLGRPKLLVPARLLKSIAADQWRGVLAHELAHLRRRDHWVRRLELAAELVWWWNPLYWAARRRLDAEAELACDAWVVWSLPDDRLTYAQVLLQICSDLSLAKSPAPALSVAGSGLFFERRLNMILRDQTTCRPSPLALMGVCVLSLAALPSWTLATTPPATPVRSASLAFDDDDDKKKDKDDKDDKKKDKDESKKSFDFDFDIDVDTSDIEKSLESAFGPDFEKSIEDWAEKLEEKLGDGSDFAEKMEAFGEEMEKKFGDGSDFAKKMEAFGEKMEKKFGEGSDFAKKMESVGKDLEKKLGPGSEFEAKMKKVAEKMSEAHERDSDLKKADAEEDSEDSSGSEKAAKQKEKEKSNQSEARAADRKAREAARLERDAARKARNADRKPEATDRKTSSTDRKPEATDRKTSSTDRKPEATDRKKLAADRKARLKMLEAKLQELAKEIKALESDDANEE